MGIRYGEVPPSMASLGNSLKEIDDDCDDFEDEDWVNPPSPAEVCDAAVKQGDVVELFNAIRGGLGQLIKHKDEFAKLHHLIESQMKDDLDGTIEMVLNHGCALTAYLLMRLRYLVFFQVDTADFLDPKSAITLCDRVMHVEQHIERMEQHLLSVQQQRATTERVRELARSKRLQNDRAEPVKERESKTPHNGTPPASPRQSGGQPTTNGQKPPVNGTASKKLHSKRF